MKAVEQYLPVHMLACVYCAIFCKTIFFLDCFGSRGVKDSFKIHLYKKKNRHPLLLSLTETMKIKFKPSQDYIEPAWP